MKDYDTAVNERLAQLGTYDLAKLAYYAFWRKLGLKVAHFDELELAIKNAWVAVGEAVIRGKADYKTNKPV